MSTQASIDILKRMALTEILKNLGRIIPSVHVSSKLNDYIRYGSSSSLALSTLYQPTTDRPIQSDFSAKILLAYLHMYTQYVVNLASYSSVDSLSTIAFSKYNYIFFKYKELYSVFEKKKLEKDYRFTQYIDFAIPSNIYTQAFTNNIFGLSNVLQLSYQNMLSLPIAATRKIYADSINSYINDATISKFISKSDSKNIFCSIDRQYGDHIGTILTVNYLSDTASSSNGITFSGKLNGFVSDTIYFKVDSIDVSNITYETSIDGIEWSNQITVSIGNDIDLFVLNDVQTGIKFSIVNTNEIFPADIWALNLDFLELQLPSASIKLIFNMIYNLSYVSLKDISSTPVLFSECSSAKILETDPDNLIIDNVKNDMQYFIPINNQIYSLDIGMQQDTSRIVPDDIGGIAYRYNFDIADIEAVSNSYYRVGSIILNPIDVESISNISLSALDQIKDKPVGQEVASSFIQYTLITETKMGLSEIPIIPKDFYTKNPSFKVGNDYYAVEPLIFNQTFSNDTYLLHDLKHFFIDGEPSNVYKLSPYSSTPVDVLTRSNDLDPADPAYCAFDKVDVLVEIRQYYAIKGKIKVNDMHSTSILDLSVANSWNVLPNGTAYMFYIDNDGLIQMAIKQRGENNAKNLLYPFTGKIFGKISMMSADEAHISPYVYNYSLGCI